MNCESNAARENTSNSTKTMHCMKSVHIRSFSGPYFPVFGPEKLQIRTTAIFHSSKRMICYHNRIMWPTNWLVHKPTKTFENNLKQKKLKTTQTTSWCIDCRVYCKDQEDRWFALISKQNWPTYPLKSITSYTRKKKTNFLYYIKWVQNKNNESRVIRSYLLRFGDQTQIVAPQLTASFKTTDKPQAWKQ